MQALTYVKSIRNRNDFRGDSPNFFQTRFPLKSKCSLFIYHFIFMILVFSSYNVNASDFSALKQGSLMFRANSSSEFINSPLVKTDVDMTITGMIARVRVTQEFHNPSEEWVNGTYVFPLPENAAVDHLMLKIGARELEGQIHPKKKAKHIFQRAKRQGKKASLVEQERPNLFTNSVANIGPNEKIEVTLEYQQLVHYHQGEFSLRFPSTLTPRYIPGDSLSSIENTNSSTNDKTANNILSHSDVAIVNQVPDAHRVTPQMKTSGDQDNLLDVKIDIDAGFAMSSISSTSHAISLSPITASRFDISLQQQVEADRDFLISWRRVDESMPFIGHFTQMYQGEEYGLMMLVPPTKTKSNVSSIPREVLFMLDISGSMQGPSIEQAKSALILGMENLSPDDTFNIVAFNSQANAYWQSARRATPSNIINARQYIHRLQANGGTEMSAALSLALKSPREPEYAPYSNETRLKQVIFITDGSVGNEEYLMQIINRKLGDKRLFTVGIGSAPNSYFMSEAAKTGKGTFTYINDINHVGQKMRNLFTQINHPVLSDIQLDLPPSVEVYPENIPDLYTGQPLLVTYKGSTWGDPIMASGSLTKASWSTTFPPAMLNAAFRQYHREPAGLNVLWARSKIAQLSASRRKASDKDTFNRVIEATALEHHIVSELTSLVAVDVTPSRPQNYVARDAAIPNNMPFGMQQQTRSLPQTATKAQIKLIIGFLFIVISLCLHLITRRQ